MLLKLETLNGIKIGRIDLVFRRWNRPSVRSNGTLKTRLGVLQIGRMDEMRAEDVTEADAQRAGFADRADFERWLATMKQGQFFHRIEVGFPGGKEG